MQTGIELIAQEREKQIKKHGFTGEHHAQHPEWYEQDQLKYAAAALIEKDLAAEFECETPEGWNQEWFNDLIGRSTHERLVIAGALIAAELDRLNALSDSASTT